MMKTLGVLAVASLALVSLNAGAQTAFTYSTTNDLTGVVVSSLNSITASNNWNGSLLNGDYFVDTPLGALNPITPTTIRLMNITPTAGTDSGVSNFNKSFNVTISLTSNAVTQAFSFNGFTLAGSLSGSATLPSSDSVVWTLPVNASQSYNVGGTFFTINVFTATRPGPIGPFQDGTLSATVTSVPEPGAVAMLVGMGLTGAIGSFRYLRRRK